MRIFITIILLIWIFVAVPLMLDIFWYYRTYCIQYRMPFSIKSWVENLRCYVPGTNSSFMNEKRSIIGAYHHWERLFEQIQKKDYIVIGIVSLIFFSFIFTAIYKLQRRRIKKSVVGDFGTAKKASKKELRPFLGKDGLVVSKRLRLSLKQSYEHVLVAGPTGSGKTRSYAMPNLLEDLSGSFVVTDPKGELFKYTSAYQQSRGKEVRVFSPQYPEHSFFYNPLYYCENDTDTRDLALTILSNGNISAEYITGVKALDTQWMTMARSLLAAGLIWAQRTGKTVSEGFDAVIKRDTDELDALFNQTGYGLEDYNLYRQSLESPRTAASIRTTMASLGQLWIDEKVRMVTSNNEFDFTQIRRRPCVVYVMVPLDKMVYYMPLLSVFFSQFFSAINKKDESALPVFFILDEFANIGRVPQIETFISTSRDNKISTSIIIQNKAQLDRIYGKDAAEAVISTIKTQIALPGLIAGSARYFSELAGITTSDAVHASTSQSLLKPITSPSHHGESFSRHQRPLYAPDEIRRMPDGKCQVFFLNANPFYDDQNRYDKNSAYRRRVEKREPGLRKLPELKPMEVKSFKRKGNGEVKGKPGQGFFDLKGPEEGPEKDLDAGSQRGHKI